MVAFIAFHISTPIRSWMPQSSECLAIP
jgi:hypothetical protein